MTKPLFLHLGKLIVSQFVKFAALTSIRHHLPREGRAYFVTAWIGLVGLIVIGLSIWPVTAAALLKYFIVVPEANKITLQWSTENEYDLSGFEVLCKQETELDNDYHVIGEVQAQGGPQQGANYKFEVMTGLEPGVSYCFALRDVTVQGRSENMFPRCGYGLGITPTPVTTATLTNTIGFDATAVIRNARATATALFFDANATAAALSASGFFTSTPTPITNTIGITATPTFTPGLNLTGTVPITATPTPIIVGTPDITATQQAILNATVQAANQPPTPTQPGGVSPLVTPGAPITATQTLTTATVPTTTAQQAPPPDGAANAAGNQVAALPSPLYIAVTQTPTPVTTPVPPTLTLLPTPLPTQSGQGLVNLFTAPDLQNLTLTLLCFTFVTTGGLGILGLITSVLYMRSRRGDNQPRR
jgi:hypothetical protein